VKKRVAKFGATAGRGGEKEKREKKLRASKSLEHVQGSHIGGGKDLSPQKGGRGGPEGVSSAALCVAKETERLEKRGSSHVSA